ncbi:MAG: histone family protein nucleoid-structuring protein H-NS [Burkholderiales bacterium PBB4]|nr:MAG: histone family protein nucleoid-structuring protein H-NS [Burkholderiales bacterium PBB4]
MATIQELSTQKEQLLQQLAAIDKQLAELQSERRQEVIAQVKTLMAQYGLTAADLAGASTARAAKAPKEASKVAAKYRDPASGSTWSGRGLKPRWLTAAIAAGKTVEDFAI